jgi:hypothetical protein
LKRKDITRTKTGQATARLISTNSRGISAADNVHRISVVLDTQRNPKIRVGLDVVADHAAGSLRRQQQMDPEAPTPLRDPDQRLNELGKLAGESRKLIDDYQQTRQWTIERGRIEPYVRNSGVAQPALAVSKLGLQTDQRSPGEMIIEIRH